MDTIREHSNEVPGSPSNGSAAPQEPFREAAERLRQEFDATLNSFQRSVYAERQALGLRIFDGAFRWGTYVWIGAVTLALAITSVYLIVASTRRGLALWTSDAWWSDLVLAVALVLAVVVAAHTLRRYVHRSALERTRRALNVPRPGTVA